MVHCLCVEPSLAHLQDIIDASGDFWIFISYKYRTFISSRHLGFYRFSFFIKLLLRTCETLVNVAIIWHSLHFLRNDRWAIFLILEIPIFSRCLRLLRISFLYQSWPGPKLYRVEQILDHRSEPILIYSHNVWSYPCWRFIYPSRSSSTLGGSLPL